MNTHDHVILSEAKNLCPAIKTPTPWERPFATRRLRLAAQGDMALGFGSRVRVMNKRQEFLWVHEKFAGEY